MTEIACVIEYWDDDHTIPATYIELADDRQHFEAWIADDQGQVSLGKFDTVRLAQQAIYQWQHHWDHLFTSIIGHA